MSVFRALINRVLDPARGTRGSRIITVMCLSIGFTGCSVDLFSDKSADDSVLNRKTYREVNLDCANMELSSNEIDVPTFRAILKCMNSNGGLKELAELVDPKLTSDEELDPIMKAITEHFLKRPKTLYQFETLFHHLKDRNLLDQRLEDLSLILKYPDFVRSVLQLANEFQSDAGVQALARISEKINATNVDRMIDATLLLLNSKANQEMLAQFRSDRVGGRSLEEVTGSILSFLRYRTQPDNEHLIKILVRAAADGNFFPSWDRTIGNTPAQIRTSIPRQATVMKTVFGNNGELINRIAVLHQLLDKPIHCISGSQSVEDPPLFFLNELSRIKSTDARYFVRVDKLLTIVAADPLCDLPTNFGFHYQAMMDLADSSAIEPAAELLQSLHKFGLGVPVLHFLNDIGDNQKGGIILATPALAEVTDRDAWESIYLLMALLPPDQRETVQSAARFLLEPVSGGASLYDLLTVALDHVRPETLARVIRGLDQLEKSGEFEKILKTCRTLFHADTGRPFVDYVQSLLSDAPKHRKLFQSLVSLSQKGEDGAKFDAALAMFSRMSQVQGPGTKLSELVGVGVSLFHNYVTRSQFQITLTEEPALPAVQDRLMHDLGRASLKRYAPVMHANATVDYCRKVQVGVDFEKQLDVFLACGEQLDASLQPKTPIARTLVFLNQEKNSRGETYLKMAMDLIRSFNMEKDQAKELVRQWLKAIQNGNFNRLVDTISLFVSGQAGTAKSTAQAVLEPLGRVLQPVFSKARVEFQAVLGFAADVLEHEKLPQVIKLAREVTDPSAQEMAREEAHEQETRERNLNHLRNVSIDHASIKDFLKQYECLDDGKHDQRIQELIHEYQYAINVWEYPNGHAKYSWTQEELKKNLKQLFEKVGEKAALLDGALNILQYFGQGVYSSDPDQRSKDGIRVNPQFDPGYLANWIKERSGDYQAVPLMYSDQDRPKVRLLSTLDRLEVLLVNADFKYILPDNFALKFLAMIGDSWGDEDRIYWPQAIQDKYPRGARPPTLRETNDKIMDTLKMFKKVFKFLGTKGPPECGNRIKNPLIKPIPAWVRNAMYNIEQVLPVLEENLPGSGHRHQNGLKVLRNVFYELHKSTPWTYRSPDSGWDNNLSVVTLLVRLGLIRQLDRQMHLFSTDSDMRELTAFITSLVRASGSKDTAPLVQSIFGQKDQKLVWNVFDQVFPLLDGTPEQVSNLKHLAFYSIEEAEKLKIIPEAITFLKHSIVSSSDKQTRRNLDFLAKNAHLINDLLKDPETAKIMMRVARRADSEKTALRDFLLWVFENHTIGANTLKVLQEVDHDPKAHAAFDTLQDRLKAVQETSAYQRLHVKDLVKDLLDYFDGSGTDVENRTAITVRKFFAARMRPIRTGGAVYSGELEEFLLLASRKPENFYQMLDGLSEFFKSPACQDFLNLVDRTLSKSDRIH